MSFQTDDHLDQFRAQSDKAFLAMQTRADEEMGVFLECYGEGSTLASFKTPDMNWNVGPTPAARVLAGTAKRKVRQALAEGEQALQKMTGRKMKGLGEDIKEGLNSTANSAAEQAQGVLRNASMDLGERAKREATALRDAARKAMQEERSLSGLKNRAKAELEAAKQRIKGELADVQADALDEFEGVAVDNIGKLGEQGLGAAEAAQRTAQLQLEDILGGGKRR